MVACALEQTHLIISPYTDLQPAHGNQYDIFKERYQLLVIISKESCELVIINPC